MQRELDCQKKTSKRSIEPDLMIMEIVNGVRRKFKAVAE
jgi:hypothetical protein